MDPGLVDGGQREIGESFLIGPIGYACWRLVTSSLSEATTLIETAIDFGMNLIDVADVYGADEDGPGFGACEEMLGRVIASSPTIRQRMVIATKSGIVPGEPYNSSSVHLRKACEASLRRLGISTIDLFQLHRPDLFTHPGEIADALVTLKEQGKIQEIGVCHHTPTQIMALQAHLPIEIGLTTLARSPLRGGRLGDGPGNADVPPVRPELIATLDRLAEREGADRAAIALAFVLCHPASPVPLIGTQQPERIKAAVASLHVRLDRADLYAIIEASEGVPLP